MCWNIAKSVLHALIVGNACRFCKHAASSRWRGGDRLGRIQVPVPPQGRINRTCVGSALNHIVHSARNAMSGSTLAALCAGSHVATLATRMTTVAMNSTMATVFVLGRPT